MKTIRILSLIFNVIAIVFILISLFRIDSLAFRIIGFVSLIVGQTLSIIISVSRIKQEKNNKAIEQDKE
ncbi:MAG: hypothetical protein J1F66_01585 [Clostridiales bacterium]|nr:hypothetical protein [Clostridiales bacterium]